MDEAVEEEYREELKSRMRWALLLLR